MADICTKCLRNAWDCACTDTTSEDYIEVGERTARELAELRRREEEDKRREDEEAGKP